MPGKMTAWHGRWLLSSGLAVCGVALVAYVATTLRDSSQRRGPEPSHAGPTTQAGAPTRWARGQLAPTPPRLTSHHVTIIDGDDESGRVAILKRFIEEAPLTDEQVQLYRLALRRVASIPDRHGRVRNHVRRCPDRGFPQHGRRTHGRRTEQGANAGPDDSHENNARISLRAHGLSPHRRCVALMRAGAAAGLAPTGCATDGSSSRVGRGRLRRIPLEYCQRESHQRAGNLDVSQSHVMVRPQVRLDAGAPQSLQADAAAGRGVAGAGRG
jgi:hypothetical protein